MSRCLLVLAALAAIQAAAFTDFHALNPNHKQTELADGMIHSTHDVHHAFPEEGTFFKANYEAIHHKKWHFVELDDHDVDFMKHVNCGSGDHELHVAHPSKSLREAVAKQNYEWTILTANHRFHCSGTGVFRAVTGSTYDSELDRLTLHTIQMKYEDVFEHLDFHLETDHFHGEVVHIESEEDLTHVLPVSQGHQMDIQWKWFKKAVKKVKKAVTNVVNKVKETVKKVVDTVKNTVKAVKDIITGDYSYKKTWPLKTLSYNKDVSKSFSKWNFVGAVKLAASAYAKPSLNFNIRVSKLKLELVEAYFAAYYKAGVRVSFNSNVKYDNSATKTISLINLNSITFKVLSIPVVISITCPITAGYDIDVDGKVNFNFLLAAYGNVKFGVRYTRARGFQAINEKNLKFTRDFSPRYFRHEIGLQAHVMANFKAAINFLGWAQASLQISAEGLLQKNKNCMVLLQITMQPIISAGAYLNVKIAGIQLFKKQWGPIVPYSTKIPVINYCLPAFKSTRSSILDRFRRNERAMLIQETAQQEAVDTNTNQVQVTRPDDISDNSTGTVWFGYRDCGSDATYQTRTISFSMQFLPGNFSDGVNSSTQIVLTLTHNNTVRNSDVYSQTNLQQTYLMNNTIYAGFSGTLQRYADESPDAQYSAADNSTLNPVIMDEQINIRVDNDDATKMWVRANSMFCGTSEIELVSQEYNDDNSTFTVFASGESTQSEDSFLEKVKAYAIYLPILLVIIAAIVIVLIVVCRKKQVNNNTQGAAWAKAPHDVEPIMQDGNVQDQRVAAL